MAKYILLCALVCALAVTCSDSQTFSIYEIPQMINADGYVAEVHHVTTEDGYILEMHRVPYRRGETEAYASRRPIVFLMHGLLAASNSFVSIGPDNSVAYNLADAGYDVWMGNNRGNKLSRYHVTLDPDAEPNQFFDYTFEDIGLYDVAAMVDYVLEFTGSEQLHYIGHSQGGTVFLVLASMKPEYNAKFTSVNLLAGVGYQEYFPNTELSLVAGLTDVIYNMALVIGAIELFPPEATNVPDLKYNATDLCTGNIKQKYLCDLVGVRHILRDDQLDNLQAGASLKQIAHYGQNIRDKLFRRWHYGLIQNMMVYGTSSPPLYDLSLITANVTMHYTVNDFLLDERDVLAMVDDMPNAVARKVARETFLHEDFAVADDAKDLVTNYIIESINIIENFHIDEDSNDEFGVIGDTEGGGVENENYESESGMGIEYQTTGSATTLTFNLTMVLNALIILIKSQ